MKKLLASAIVAASLLAPALSRATTWNIDPAHTDSAFTVKHMMISNVKGQFIGVKGALTLDESNVINSRVEASIDAGSINTYEAQRDAHLKSADFFDVIYGSNGYLAGPGYDLVTGLGSPYAPYVVVDLALGMHTLTFRVDGKERGQALLRCELADVPGSNAQARFVGGR